MRKKVLILLIISVFLCGCNLLIKDEIKTGINYVPLAFNVQSISYTKTFDSDDVVTKLSHIEGSQYKLNIYAPLTDSKDVNVERIKISENVINVDVSASKEKQTAIRRPLISINVSGLNPYIEDKYSVKINPLYKAYNLNLKQDEAVKILKSNVGDNIKSPIFAKVLKSNKNINWNLGYYEIDNENENIYYKNISIDDYSNKIISKSKKSISSKLFNGQILGILNGDNIVYLNNNNVYSYYIPTKSVERLDINLTTFKIHKMDNKTNSIFIFSDSALYKLGGDFKFEKLFDLELNIKKIAVGNDEIFLLTNENEIFSYKNNEIKKIYTSNENVESMDYSDDLYIETDKKRIYKIKNHFNQIIDDGESIKCVGSYLYYLKKTDRDVNLVVYNTESGLKVNLYSSEKINIENESNNILIFYDTSNSVKKVYSIQNEMISYLINLPNGKFYATNNPSFGIAEINEKIYKLDIRESN